MSSRQRASNDKAGVFETLWSDFRSVGSEVTRAGVGETVRQTFADLDRFYLDDGQQRYLASVGAVRRWFWRSWWLLKSLFLRLAPARRVLLLLSFVLLWVSVQGTVGPGSARVDLSFVGVFLILLVLLLELKDKLLARDELEEGRAVQRALLPDPDPAIPGWYVWLTSVPANDDRRLEPRPDRRVRHLRPVLLPPGRPFRAHGGRGVPRVGVIGPARLARAAPVAAVSRFTTFHPVLKLPVARP